MNWFSKMVLRWRVRDAEADVQILRARAAGAEHALRLALIRRASLIAMQADVDPQSNARALKAVCRG